MGDIIVRGAGDRVRPQRFAIEPIRGLDARTENQSNQNDCGEAAQHQSAMTPAGPQTSHRPGQGEIQPDLRQISIAIRICLASDLDQPDHRHQHSQIPQPADQQIGLSSPLENYNR